MNPKVIIFEDPSEISQYAVDFLEKALKKKPNIVLGVPTGKTMIPIYEKIAEAYKKGKLNFSKAKIFDVDEYIGLRPEQKQSFKYFLDKNLFKQVNFKEKNIHFLNGKAINISKECDNYENEIKKAGGLDITALGIGVNGHIAFNEPGSPFDSRTREVVLTYQTMKSNFGQIYSLMKSPKRALTIGIATILESRIIALIATGGHKAKAVKEMLESPISTKCPASVLRKHPNVTILLDKKAASLLKNKH